MKRRLHAGALAVIAAALPFFATPAAAQESEGRGWIVTLGAGPQIYPKYPGADSYGINPMPILGLRREGAPRPFEAPDEGAGFGFLGPSSRFDFGPAIRFQNKREEDDVGAAVGDVGFTVEAGAFAQAYVTDNFRLRVEGRRGIGGHDGWVGDVSADFVMRSGDRTIFSIGPRARIANGRYHRAYFGVDDGVAAATGLPVYRLGSGVYAVGATAGITHMLNQGLGLYAYAGYDRLVGDAADSPIVRAFGSRDQFSGGIGLFLEFGVGGR
ncbi:MipA/OmpV family protein [Sphingosinicella sp. LHD-64]|uniref:MipA/OmpV family protein n=1 Tax=Sphingosinicella sp. LHD-64 TaxID=3072139 RepID=UPI00280F96E7|nr:MipA/OmpV family protein [Sphingosinicella sp. LHD-64]MDQ8758078.1 MipA/OmpV family protein [Sphingosinicella sp. LHD-64]